MIEITTDAYKDGLAIKVRLQTNDEFSAIEMIIEGTTYSIPLQKFVAVLSMLVEEREIDNLKKQITFLQNKQLELERQIKIIREQIN